VINDVQGALKAIATYIEAYEEKKGVPEAVKRKREGK